ncbi:hypothetical protein PUN28_010071 [Cardiocondyla obscurior]|uniref:Photosystem II protein I n=1 Tax=Cardiocondyla obscurior TaxID=286306 RepID=A0AAW2FNU6_9HYME
MLFPLVIFKFCANTDSFFILARKLRLNILTRVSVYFFDASNYE